MYNHEQLHFCCIINNYEHRVIFHQISQQSNRKLVLLRLSKSKINPKVKVETR